ncbi:MAG: LPXTG cell wall anchor domain-containing protein [Sporocytophaga sp.]|uniref:LPXTG cell wall anchor domain-containing protein n=1 Tax=Sporocytophaga sp. TaxID=2231183 RepID=UPI001B2D379B|nr:LPXTG cell wall anchor domain-containing protein [Sporocytophaga sp.]MBO9698614.1 LPXTG cell wall anchor domain-containing protein [Sporocytophaga sp.]
MKIYYTVILTILFSLNAFAQAPSFDTGAPEPVPAGDAAAIPLEGGSYIFLAGGLISGGILLLQLRKRKKTI